MAPTGLFQVVFVVLFLSCFTYPVSAAREASLTVRTDTSDLERLYYLPNGTVAGFANLESFKMEDRVLTFTFFEGKLFTSYDASDMHIEREGKWLENVFNGTFKYFPPNLRAGRPKPENYLQPLDIFLFHWGKIYGPAEFKGHAPATTDEGGLKFHLRAIINLYWNDPYRDEPPQAYKRPHLCGCNVVLSPRGDTPAVLRGTSAPDTFPSDAIVQRLFDLLPRSGQYRWTTGRVLWLGRNESISGRMLVVFEPEDVGGETPPHDFVPFLVDVTQRDLMVRGPLLTRSPEDRDYWVFNRIDLEGDGLADLVSFAFEASKGIRKRLWYFDETGVYEAHRTPSWKQGITRSVLRRQSGYQ